MVQTTWDGSPVATDKPFAAAVVVHRQRDGEREYLLLHRRHHGAAYEGEWAWTGPAGARQPGEESRAAAARELHEETGLALELEGPLEHVTDEVVLFAAEAAADADVVLDPEHDRFAWVPLAVAIERCLPPVVGEGFTIVARHLGDSIAADGDAAPDAAPRSSRRAGRADSRVRGLGDAGPVRGRDP